MNWRGRALKYSTLFVILVLILNPDTFQLGLFIDAAGLDLLFLLLEAQFLTIARPMFRQLIR